MADEKDEPEALDDAALDTASGGEVVRDAGLRSDGELVQAKKAKPGTRFWDTLPPD